MWARVPPGVLSLRLSPGGDPLAEGVSARLLHSATVRHSGSFLGVGLVALLDGLGLPVLALLGPFGIGVALLDVLGDSG